MKNRLILLLFSFVALLSYAQTKQQADSLHQQGRAYLNEGKIAEGRECTRQAMEMRKALLGEVSEDYITSLNNYALTFSMEENYAKAVELQEQVLSLCGRLKQPHKNIGMFTTNMGRYYYLNGDKRNAAKMWEQALPMVEKFSEIYEFLLNSLGSIYSDADDQQGLSRILALMEEHNEHELTKPCDEPKCMLDRALYYSSAGNQAKANECFHNVMDMPMDDEMRIKVFESYAHYKAMTERDRLTGAEYQFQAAMLRKNTKGEDAEYAKSIFNAGLFYSFAMTDDSFRKAITCYDQAHDVFEKLNNAPMIAKCQQMKGNAFSGLKDYEKAKECYARALVYYETNDKESRDYPKMIERVAAMEKFNKEYDASITHYRQAMQLYEQRGMMEEYANAENGLKMCYAYAGRSMSEATDNRNQDAIKAAEREKLDKLINDEKSNLELTRTYLGKLMYARSLGTIAGCYFLKEEYGDAVDYYRQYVHAIREAVREEFRMESETERMHTWQEEMSNISQLQELLVTLPDTLLQYKNDLTSIVYDAELLSKGILLNSSIEFEKLLNDKNDQRLLEIYQKTKSNRNEIERLRMEGNSESDLEKILKLTQENQRLQIQLNKDVQEMEDFTQYISYDWKDVQNGLKDSDVSIEFVSVNLSFGKTDSHMVALLLTKNMSHPEAVVLWAEDGLKQNALLAQDSNMFVKPEAGKIVWGRLAPYLQGKKRIFFSADGILNNIGIEYLLFDGKPISEQFEVYRLSSTKELCYQHRSVKLEKAVLFGDINYNQDATQSIDTQRSLASLRGAGEIASFAELKNTRREVDDIHSILINSGMRDVPQLCDTEASKSAFMSLTDSRVNVLHVATHGMYKDVKQSTDAESMQNSMLVFAGANLDDNSFVTAADIASMNLRQCDLAVLSACETGLGKLGGDGVFGLQRGFKNAGVHTLLMSLKKVYDASTADLMISFYRHLMSGATKREALVKAQQDIRSKGYNDPKYWAVFILLDAY